MAKKDYPGLVIVPPSDRTILRRRLLRWSLFILPVLWITWTVMGSPSASRDDADCREGGSEGTPRGPAEECSHSEQATATVETRENGVGLTQTSQADNPADPQHAVPSPTPEAHRPSPEPTSQEAQTPKPSVTKDFAPDRPEPRSTDEKLVARVSSRKLASSLPPDSHLAEQGDAFAQYRLGKYHAQQKGRESPESISWYKKASAGLRRLAEAGNGQAMYVLGVMYAYGRGVARNTDEARRWLKRAVEQNVPAAQLVLASLEPKPTVEHRPKERVPAHTAAP